MESDTFYEDFMVTLIWRMFGDLIYDVFSMKTRLILPLNLHKYHFPHGLHTVSTSYILVIRLTIKCQTNYIISRYYGENTFFFLWILGTFKLLQGFMAERPTTIFNSCCHEKDVGGDWPLSLQNL